MNNVNNVPLNTVRILLLPISILHKQVLGLVSITCHQNEVDSLKELTPTLISV